MNRKIKLTLMLTVACLTLVSFTACGSKGDEIQQELVEVTRGEIMLSVTGDGDLSLPQHRKLPFRTIGDITEVNVEEGNRVSKGQVLAKLDTTSLEQAVRTKEQLLIKNFL